MGRSVTRNGFDGQHREVLISHSYPLVVQALTIILNGFGFTIVARCSDGISTRAALHEMRPDIAIIGIDLDGVTGLDLLRELRVGGSDTRTILLCPNLNAEALLTAVEAGVDGLLLMHAPIETVHSCVAAVHDGRQWLDPSAMKVVLDRVTTRSVQPLPTLTRRERDVARLVAAGQRNRTIADALGISEGTVKMHLHNVYAKLGLESRTQLAMDMRIRPD